MRAPRSGKPVFLPTWGEPPHVEELDRLAIQPDIGLEMLPVTS